MKRNKQILKGSIGAGVLMLLLFSSFAMAGTFDMNMDALGGSASVITTVESDPWDNTDMAVGASNESATNQVNLNNNGDVPLNVECKSTDTAGWTIETAAGANQYRLTCKENSAGSYVNLGTTNTAVFVNLGVGVNKDFRFYFYMPTSTTHYGAQQATITFTISEYT